MFADARFDVTHLAINQMRGDRFAPAKVDALKSVASVLPSVMREWFSGAVCKRIDSKTETVASKALFFRGASEQLFHLMSNGGAAQTVELVEQIDDFMTALYEGLASCKSAVASLTKHHASSRVANSLEQMGVALQSLSSAVAVLRTVAVGGSMPGFVYPFLGIETWETALAHQQDVFSFIRKSVRDGEASDIDDELLALAQEAIIASDNRNLLSDAGWADRLSHERVH